jgi:AAA domain, putative AbiEii toxin, Type IV TA system
MQIPLLIRLEHLWGNEIFKKENCGAINYLVGSNGSGKSLFLQEVLDLLKKNNIPFRYLSTDRLISWTDEQTISNSFSSSPYGHGIDNRLFDNLKQVSKSKGQVDDAFIILKENLSIRIKIESIVSQILKRTVTLHEEGGFLIPRITKGNNVEYTFKEQESHGIKMFIMMLTLLLHDDGTKFFIIDEPELYLHPQFQIHLLQEIRKLAGDPSVDEKKRCFFLATHSPYFIDIRSIDDLKNCIIFQVDKLPKYIEKIEPEDEYKLRQALPQINAHHKQLFFSSKPIFVEGYRDQQIFSLIQERRGKFVGSSGSTFIDVNGKDVLDLFYRLCKQLSIECLLIVDLDVLIAGKIRDSISKDERSRKYLQEHFLKDGMKLYRK